MLSGEISKFSVIVTADVSLGLYRSQISMYKRLAVCKELQNCFSDLATIRQLRLLFLLKKKKGQKELSHSILVKHSCQLNMSNKVRWCAAYLHILFPPPPPFPPFLSPFLPFSLLFLLPSLHVSLPFFILLHSAILIKPDHVPCTMQDAGMKS